jgi:hypothetical protein
VAEAVIAGILLGGKRAVVMALVHGLRSLQLGQTAVRLVFTRRLGVAESQESGSRDGALVLVAERLPLAQAESRLTAAVTHLLAAPAGEGGWFRRRVRGLLLRTVQRLTLARFREEGDRFGGVDLGKVQADLETRADGMLLRGVRGGLKLWTVLAASFRAREGIKGLLVRDEKGIEAAYMLIEPASGYFRTMTRSDRMPVLVGDRI